MLEIVEVVEILFERAPLRLQYDLHRREHEEQHRGGRAQPPQQLSRPLEARQQLACVAIAARGKLREGGATGWRGNEDVWSSPNAPATGSCDCNPSVQPNARAINTKLHSGSVVGMGPRGNVGC